MGEGGRQIVSGDEFRKLSHDYQRKARELQAITRYLQGQINGAMWDGTASAKFRSEWNQHRRNLDQLEQILAELSDELKKRAPLADELNRRR
ncbi:MAG TPA: WXG100 family type VII secretion target [Chloroflexota bacterium]|jgi:WXG100 family type VII secretion target|nr:WXG100 family type VII secretion target [Chloroflexota bacterium]